MSAASSFTHSFPIVFDVDAQTLLRCNTLTGRFQWNNACSLMLMPNILDSPQVGLDNATNFKNCALALEDLELVDRGRCHHHPFLERMTESLRGCGTTLYLFPL